MAHSYGSCLFHFTFSTKNHQHLIAPEWRPRLWEYMGGIAKASTMKSLCIGGTSNHAHVLLLVPPRMAPAKAVQLIKGGSSRWVHESIPGQKDFAWQEGYAVFSIGFSQVDATRRYIANQEEHHRTKTFEEEYRAFLKKHEIAFDEEFFLG